MKNTLLENICSELGVTITELELDASFIQNGGHSLSAAAIVTSCNSNGPSVKSRDLLSNASIRELLKRFLPCKNTSTATVPDSATPINSIAISEGFCGDLQDQAQSRKASTSSIPGAIDGRSPAHSIRNDIHGQPMADFYSSMDQSEEMSITSKNYQGHLTDMQLSFIQGSLRTPGMNIIAYSECYLSRDLSRIKAAWMAVIQMESVFNDPDFGEFRNPNNKGFRWFEASSPFTKEEVHSRIAILSKITHVEFAFHVFQHHVIADEEQTCTVSWIVHHAFIDGYSASLLVEKMQRLTAGLEVQPGRPFSKFKNDLREFRISRMAEGNAFWEHQKDLIDNARGTLLLPIGCPKSPKIEFDEVCVDVRRLKSTLQSIALDFSVTVPLIFNAAWTLVLSRYVDSRKPVFGAVFSGRDLPFPGIRDICGPVLNTLPLVLEIDQGSSTKTFLRSAMNKLIELSEYQWTTADNGFHNDYESALAVQFRPQKRPEGAVAAIGEPHIRQATDIPLIVLVEPYSKIRLVYQCWRYRRVDILRIATSYFQALQLMAHKSLMIGEIMEGLFPLTSRGEVLRFGNLYSKRTMRQSVTEDLVTLYECNVRKIPLEPAVQRGNCSLTYSEYDNAASCLAKHLSKTVRGGEVICVHADRSINWIVAIFGILKTGATYCSLDAGLPSNLRNLMFKNSGARYFIVSDTDQVCYKPQNCEQCVVLDELLVESRRQEVLPHRIQPEPWTMAYLCYTSGSTGTPKGVKCTHEGLVAFQSDLEVRLFSQPGSKISQVMSPAFDGSIHEIFSALCYGACIVLPEPGDTFGHIGLVDSAILTPSIARVLEPTSFPRLKNVYLVGEPVPQYISDKWSKHKQLYNMYGPTEGTCGATIKRLWTGHEVTVGRANPTTRIYILDTEKNVTIPGVEGEIYLAGIQIAKGYQNLPDQTSACFLPDTIAHNGELMYRTGDKGYWNEDGEVVCLGRNDRQTKIRGYRLDMNDLELRIAQVAPELEAVAITSQNDYLVCMVQPASTDIKGLLARISSVLPSYAIPRYVKPVESIPTTRTGKIDYVLLSNTKFQTMATSVRDLTTSTERIVGATYKKILDLDDHTPIHAQSDFLDLGGHSLRQLSLSLHLGREIRTKIPLQLVIENPTVEALAAAIDSILSVESTKSTSQMQIDEKSVSFAEEDWYRRYEVGAGLSCFNVAFASEFDPDKIDRRRLADAWDIALSRHDILRCRYVCRPCQPVQRIHAEYSPRAERVRSVDLWTEINRPFQLVDNPPIRVTVTTEKLVVVISHIVADYTTLSILLREAAAIYKGEYLPAIKHDYIDALRSREPTGSCHLSFWSTYLDGAMKSPELFGLRLDREDYRGTSCIRKIPKLMANKITSFANSSIYTLQQLASAAVALVLSYNLTDTDVVMITPYLNRNTEESVDTVGLFVEPLLIRVKFDDNSNKDELNPHQNHYLDAVHASSQAALAHAVPWKDLLERLAVPKCYPNHPITDVAVSFHDSFQTRSLSLGKGDGFESCFIWSEGSKFKLMVEFSELENGGIMLRLEHDPTCISSETVCLLQNSLPAVLEWLCEGLGHTEVKDRIRARYDEFTKTFPSTDDTRAYILGTRLSEL